MDHLVALSKWIDCMLLLLKAAKKYSVHARLCSNTKPFYFLNFCIPRANLDPKKCSIYKSERRCVGGWWER